MNTLPDEFGHAPRDFGHTLVAGLEEKPFEWSEEKLKAALLLAQGDKSDAEVAEEAGVGVRSLYRWKRYPAFIARVQFHLADMAATARRHGVARVDKRLSRLNADWNQIQQDRQKRAARWSKFIEENGNADPDDPKVVVPQEVLSGNFVRSVRAVGKGEDFRLIVEYKLDTATLAELRAIERQAAMESGDWKEAGAKKDGVAPGAPGASFPVPNQAGPRLDNMLAYIEWLRAEDARGGPAIAPRKEEGGAP